MTCSRGRSSAGLEVPLKRRTAAVFAALCILSALTVAARIAAASPPAPQRVPVIDVTDLYHPHQDVGDNFDLIAAYALPTVELRAVILDAHARFRKPFRNADGVGYDDATGPRDAGFIPVLQLNDLFDRRVPCAPGPYTEMRSLDDRMEDAPRFQQAGVDLLLRALRESRSRVHILSFGSARPVALAFNRDPGLLRRKVARIHLCAGASPAGYLEWNVMLDRRAFVQVLRSGLPTAVYPCANERSPFELGPNNTYWKLPNLEFVRRMDPRLQSYVAYAFERSARSDFLNAVEERPDPAAVARIAAREHHVWETSVWAQVAGLRLVQRPGVGGRLVPAAEVRPGDVAVPERLVPCRLRVTDDGQFTWERTSKPTPHAIFQRDDPARSQAALREALPALYESFRTPGAQTSG